MGLFDGIASKIAAKMGLQVQTQPPDQRERDYRRKGSSFSVECEISEKLASLAVMLSTMPVAGESERAAWLDRLSDEFFRTRIGKVLATAFISGDCLVVPSWTGRGIQNIIIQADDFAVLQTMGDELTAVAYVIDRAQKNGTEYQLCQAVELVPYTAADGSAAYANRYRVFVSRNGSLGGASLEEFPQWQGRFEPEWVVPNVERLLVGRFKSFTLDPVNPNRVKGVPICFGASEPLAEIRFLLDQMHDEFSLSEKVIMADKRLFGRKWVNGEPEVDLPKGKKRLFMDVTGQASEVPIHDWSPDIRYEAYLRDLDKQEQLLERAVGVSRGIISSPDDLNYMNVDNVRKSQQSTISFIDSARAEAENMLSQLVYAWDVLANYFNIVPMGDYAVSFDWSDDYIETFSDRQNAILAGEAIGATDAADYRQFLFDESPEAARQRVEEIKAGRGAEVVALAEV